MPFKTDSIYINCPFLDRRTKLLPCQKEMVAHYSNLGYSQRKLAKMFNVSKRLIQFVIAPEKLAKNKDLRKDRGGSVIYYKKDNHNKSIREHRRYKYDTLKNTINNN
jgi:transposase